MAASLTPLVAGCRQASLVSPSPSPPIARIADPSVSQAPVSPPIGDIAAPVDLVVIPSAVDREMLMLPIANTPLARVGGVASTEGLLSGIYRYVLLSRSSESRVTALSAICTHEGCIVRRFAAPVFECPCHGSRYDQGGRVVRGPAPAALPELSVEFDGEVARIRF